MSVVPLVPRIYFASKLKISALGQNLLGQVTNRGVTQVK